MLFPRYTIFAFFLGLRGHTLVNSACSAGHFDLSGLTKWNPWPAVANISGETSQFSFNFCGSGTVCPGSLVCWQKSGGATVNFGSESSDLGQPTLNQATGGFRLDFVGDHCGVENKNWTTSIEFKCGTTLGSPEFLSNNTCTFVFEWHTTVACTKDSIPADSEVPCYVYDRNYRKRDLTPLIKQTGGYFVNSDGDRDFYVNVCRDITVTPDTATSSCPRNSSGCQIKDGSPLDAGVAVTRLEIIEDKLRLRYATNVLHENCNGYKPTTKITFVCPREGGRFGGSKDPVLISDTNCHYIVEWQTEYACEVDLYTSNGECSFTYDNDGVDIDLTPLKNHETPFLTDDGHDSYYIAVCKPLVVDGCPPDAAVCQGQLPNFDSPHSAGKSTAYNLRYTDGEVTLTYSEGEPCPHNGFQRTSVISFRCNRTVGIGSPKFINEVHCMYFFVWETQHVCLEHSRDTSCRVNHGSQRYDLSSLVREHGKNWVALDGQHDHDQANDGVYYINICANILPGDDRTTACPAGSSACFVDHADNARNLGQFRDSPTYEDGEIVLKYVDGGDAGNCHTTIRFICTPGDMESAPSLVRTLSHSCEYEFEWRTAAACPLGRRIGENCQVFDEDAGFTFDLSPLTRSEGYHNFSSDGYDYYLNVCDELSGTPCIDDEPNQHTGACQVEQQGSHNHFRLGMSNSTLEYYDGILKLSYRNGDRYHPLDGKAAQRQADIVFLCDMTATGDGRIEFTSEANNTYTFQWYTVYACPQPPVECIVTDGKTHVQYDLSSLSKALDEDNWSYVDSRDATSKQKYYINVCRPVNPLSFCGPFAAACKTGFQGEKEVVAIKNLGMAVSAPTIESEGNLLLTYINGSVCRAGKRIETRIHLRCRRGELASSPRLLEVLDDGCVYSFLWETEAACPIATSEGTNCSVIDKNSGYTFNLRSLAFDPFYEPTKKSNDLPTTRINICSEVKNNVCEKDGKPAGACVQDGNAWLPLGLPSSTLTYSDDGLLTLTYLGELNVTTAKHNKAVITFVCRHNITVTTKRPETVSCDGVKECHFNFETPLACLPEPVDCLVSDSAGNQYDLTSLAKDTGNWEAVDTREGHGHQSYHINVCRPLNSLDPEVTDCPGGPIAACQTESGKSSNLGYVQAMPDAADDGTLTIRYVGGDRCDDNADLQKSTRINFECSDTPGSPVFQTRTELCEYVFTWQTPAACPAQSQVGTSCHVSVEELGYEFDLSSLYNVNQDYEVSSGDHKYRINVCGSLVSETTTCPDGVGSCQEQKDGTPMFNAGLANGMLRYDSGVLKLNYTRGAPCHNSIYERSTAINFVCDNTPTALRQGNGHPVFIRETDDCTYLFEWATPLACPPFRQVECSYRGDDLQYDLAPLGAIDDNYQVSSSEGNEVFYLGVCKSLSNENGKKGSECPTNAAACMKVPGDGERQPDRFINLGHVTTGPTMEGDHLVLRYESGTACPSGDKKRSTVINFDCDPQSIGSLPEFQYSEDNCTYYFLWMDKLACGISHEDAEGTDCTVANPVTGFQFDLRVLQGIRSVNIAGYDQHIYNISICKALEGSMCEGSNVGACQAQKDVQNPKHFITGLFTRRVFFDDGVLSLQYGRGTPCHNRRFHRSTVISFVCPHEEESLGEPVFISESQDCTYYFSWHTSAACEQYIQCSVMNGTETVDLSPLVQRRGYYVATTDTDIPGTIYINLCRPLNPIQGMRCPPNAAVCHVTSDGQPKSLGRIEGGPQLDTSGRLFIQYTNGAQCPEEPTRNVSSMIRFVCQRGEEKGVPKLISYSDCQYLFEWSTYVVCPPAPASVGEDCTYHDEVMQYVFDLNPLSHKPYTIVASGSKQICLQLCGTLPSDTNSQCEGAAVCLKEGQSSHSLGKASAQEFVFEGGNLKVTYSDGSTCPDDEHGTRETTIIFMCSSSRTSDAPTFFTADANFCHTTLQWNTPIACPPQTMPCTVTSDDGSSHYDLQALSQITGSWTAEDHDNDKYFINVCKPALSTPMECPNDATVCRRQPSIGIEVLGKVHTQRLQYKGEDRLLLTYSEGRVFTCGGPDTVTRDGYKSRVEIGFTCSSVIGKPVFKSKTVEDGTCIFSFTWSSKVACKVERESVKVNNGKVIDPVTEVELDLNPILNGGEEGTWLVEGDDRGESSNSLDEYRYHILLKEGASMDLPGTSEECKSAVICQTKTDDRFFRNIGDQAHKRYFIEDDTLEMITTNPGSCRKDDSDVLSTVIFECDPEKTPGNPEFMYESGNCQYFFIWQTSHVCQSISGDGSPQVPSSSGRGAKKGSFGKVFLVLLIVASVATVVFVFRKRERRSAVYVRIRRCFPGAYSNVPTYSYVQLSTGDNVDGTADEARGLFDSDAEDEEILKETHPNPLEYKDDSDEDLLADSGV